MDELDEIRMTNVGLGGMWCPGLRVLELWDSGLERLGLRGLGCSV